MATPCTSMRSSFFIQTVQSYDPEDMDEKRGYEAEEGTVSSTLVVVNPRELQPDDDAAASFQLVVPPHLPPQHDLSKSRSDSDTSSTFDPALYMTGVWTPSHPQDWCDELEHGPDPIFVLGRRNGINVFAGINIPGTEIRMGAKETKEDESEHQTPDEAPAAAPATEVTLVTTEPQGRVQLQKLQLCLNRQSTVAKLVLFCWCLVGVLTALVSYQILAHKPILPFR